MEGGWRRVGGRGCQYEGVMVLIIAYVYSGLGGEAERLFFRLGFTYKERGQD